MRASSFDRGSTASNRIVEIAAPPAPVVSCPAGVKAVPRQLLPGEAARSDQLDDAEHWAAVYQELITFLDRGRLCRPETTDRYRRRLDYWRHRQEELATWSPAR